jgi:16S rRNA (cytosine967-C5)-methyltransferase
MDCVLVDAPCTGSGTWRRRPDAKWRLSDRNIAQRCDEQHSVLEEAARFVRPGGRLVYVTCSLLVQENSGQIDRFLQENADFSCASGYAVLQQLCNSAHIPRSGLAMVLLTPAMTNTDGFFIAQLEKSRI